MAGSSQSSGGISGVSGPGGSGGVGLGLGGTFAALLPQPPPVSLGDFHQPPPSMSVPPNFGGWTYQPPPHVTGTFGGLSGGGFSSPFLRGTFWSF